MRRKTLTADQEAQLRLLRQRLLFTLQFMQNVQDFPAGKSIERKVCAAADRGDIRNLLLIAREVDMMVTLASTPHERDGLEALLKARFGVDKEFERAKLQRVVESILERGTIRSEKERRHLEDYAEILAATHGDEHESERVRQLLRASEDSP